MGRIRNEYNRGTVQAEWSRDKVREARLREFGHVQSGGGIVDLLRPQRKFVDVAKEGNRGLQQQKRMLGEGCDEGR